MNPADKQIADILARYGEDFAENTWPVPGGKARAIYHKCIERIVAQARITFEPPQVITYALDNVAIVVTGRMGERAEWSFGEASPKNNKNAYPFAMAEKRAKDRVALKLIGLHGLIYSEEEADEFKEARPRRERRSPAQGEDDPVEQMKSEIDRRPTPDAITLLMKDLRTKRALKRMGDEKAAAVRTYATERFRQLKAAAESPPAEPRDEDRPRPTGMSPTKQAGILCGDPRFQRFLCERGHAGEMSEEEAVGAVYGICGIRSRRELVPGSPAAMAWTKLVQDFEAWKVEPVA